jgi:predicted enzyme related to lactoylglutathione lyase
MTKRDAQLMSTILVVDDLEKSAAFYKAVFGLTEVMRLSDKLDGRDFTEVMFNFRGEGPANFVLMQYADGPKPVIGEALTVFATEDIEGFVKRAAQHGAVIVDAPLYNAKYGVTSAFLKDVEGHMFGVFEQASAAVPA